MVIVWRVERMVRRRGGRNPWWRTLLSGASEVESRAAYDRCHLPGHTYRLVECQEGEGEDEVEHARKVIPRARRAATSTTARRCAYEDSSKVAPQFACPPCMGKIVARVPFYFFNQMPWGDWHLWLCVAHANWYIVPAGMQIERLKRVRKRVLPGEET